MYVLIMILIIVTRSIRVINLCAWVEATQDGAHN